MATHYFAQVVILGDSLRGGGALGTALVLHLHLWTEPCTEVPSRPR